MFKKPSIRREDQHSVPFKVFSSPVKAKYYVLLLFSDYILSSEQVALSLYSVTRLIISSN